MRVTILGKRWEMRFTRLPKDTDGECDPPERPGKEIRIQQGLSEENLLSTIVHECLHASDWHRTEAWVEEVADDIAKILIKVGFSRTGLDDEET